jgi:hypothetical protein
MSFPDVPELEGVPLLQRLRCVFWQPGTVEVGAECGAVPDGDGGTGVHVLRLGALHGAEGEVRVGAADAPVVGQHHVRIAPAYEELLPAREAELRPRGPGQAPTMGPGRKLRDALRHRWWLVVGTRVHMA